MIAKIHTGRGIAPLVDYVTHDAPARGDDERPTTADRVAHVESIGLPGVAPETMTRCMQGLTADQRSIKVRAGTSTRGRTLRDPYTHLIISWPPDQTPTTEEATAAAREALAAVGIRVPTRFVQNYTVRGSAGRGGAASSTPNGRPEPAQAPPGGTLLARTRGRSSESPTSSSSTTRALPGAPRVRSEIRVALRTSCCTGRPACPWNAASGYFLTDTHHGTRPWCQTVQPERAFLGDDVLRPPHRGRGVHREDLADAEPVAEHASTNRVASTWWTVDLPCPSREALGQLGVALPLSPPCAAPLAPGGELPPAASRSGEVSASGAASDLLGLRSPGRTPWRTRRPPPRSAMGDAPSTPGQRGRRGDELPADGRPVGWQPGAAHRRQRRAAPRRDRLREPQPRVRQH